MDVKFLANDDVLEEYDSANTDAIKSVLVKQIAAAKPEKNRLTGLATDGFSIMTGKRNEVAAKMRQKCKLLLNVHCICHHLVLACGNANDHVSYIKVVEKSWCSCGHFSQIRQSEVHPMPRQL